MAYGAKRKLVIRSVLSILTTQLMVAQTPKPVSPERELVRRLAFSIAADRCAAAIELGGLGERAAPAISSLIALFTDNTTVVRKASAEGSRIVLESETSPAEEAAFALGRIGRSAIEPLLAVVANKKADAFEDRFMRHYAAVALGRAAVTAGVKDARVIDNLLVLLDPSEQTFVTEGADAGLSVFLRNRPRSYWRLAEWKKWLAENPQSTK